jgi:hypothetical protein
MSKPGQRQRTTFTKIEARAPISPDDLKFKMLERDRLAAADTRTDEQRWLGDPPPHRSALAQKKTANQV